MNCFTDRMHDEIALALAEVGRDHDDRVLLLTGAGRGFCAGQDLSERDENDPNPNLGARVEGSLNRLIRSFAAMPIPVVCAVNGAAAGAGVGLALAADICVARKSAKFVQAFGRIGLALDAGTSWQMPRRVGLARAMAFNILGEPLMAEEAVQWGLIWRAYDDDVFEEEVDALIDRLANGPTRAWGLTKLAVRAGATNALEEALDIERNAQQQAGDTRDYREGVAAFKAKRAPVFEGR
jgi:2-(1,2-epoxy-1,2-dihydrophenyl)acetyl-CoA isomerase